MKIKKSGKDFELCPIFCTFATETNRFKDHGI